MSEQVMGQRPRLLVAAGPVGRTVEGIVLLETVRWLAEHAEGDVRVILTARGELTDELAALAPTTVVSELDERSWRGLIARAWFRLGYRERGYRSRAKRLGLSDEADCQGLYLHTVAAVEVLRYLPASGCPVVARLSGALEPDGWGLSPSDQSLLVGHVDRYLTDEVRHRAEVRAMGGDVERVRTLEPLLGPLLRPGADRGPTDGNGVERSSEASPACFTVGAFAPSPPEDPPDLPIHLASLVALARPTRPVRWVWMVDREAVAFWVEHDLARLGLDTTVRLVRSPGERDEQFRRCDLLVFVPREDAPVPRVYLEAAAAGVPLVGHEGGALSEYVGADEGGSLVAYLDVEALAQRVAALADDPQRYRRCRELVAERTNRRHGIPSFASALWSELTMLWNDDG